MPTIAKDLDASTTPAPVDRLGLHAGLRLAADHGRRARRPPRPQALVPDRPGALHGDLARGGVLAEHRDADRDAGAAGARRGVHHAALALADLGRLPAGRAGQGGRHLGRDLGLRRSRSGRSSAALLVEYASWQWVFLINVPIGIGAFLVTSAVVRESQDESGDGRDRHPGHGPDHRPRSRALTYGLIEAGNRGWGDRADPGLLRRRGGRLGVAFVWVESKTEAADGAAAVLPLAAPSPAPTSTPS